MVCSEDVLTPYIGLTSCKANIGRERKKEDKNYCKFTSFLFAKIETISCLYSSHVMLCEVFVLTAVGGGVQHGGLPARLQQAHPLLRVPEDH